MKLSGSSCVVVADQHNPSILNPDWLVKTEIIDPEWKLADPSITTPLFARCFYINKVQLALEPNKLTVSRLPADNNGLSGELPRIVRKYVESLPHIPYKQLGNNFRFSTDMQDVLSKLKNKLIKEGNWNTDNISKIKTTFQYFCNDYKINLTVESPDTGEKSKTGKETSTLILDFNYHRELDGLSSLIRGTDSWQNDYEDAMRRTKKIVEGIN